MTSTVAAEIGLCVPSGDAPALGPRLGVDAIAGKRDVAIAKGATRADPSGAGLGAAGQAGHQLMGVPGPRCRRAAVEVGEPTRAELRRWPVHVRGSAPLPQPRSRRCAGRRSACRRSGKRRLAAPRRCVRCRWVEASVRNRGIPIVTNAIESASRWPGITLEKGGSSRASRDRDVAFPDDCFQTWSSATAWAMTTWPP